MTKHKLADLFFSPGERLFKKEKKNNQTHFEKETYEEIIYVETELVVPTH